MIIIFINQLNLYMYDIKKFTLTIGFTLPSKTHGAKGGDYFLLKTISHRLLITEEFKSKL